MAAAATAAESQPMSAASPEPVADDAVRRFFEAEGAPHSPPPAPKKTPRRPPTSAAKKAARRRSVFIDDEAVESKASDDDDEPTSPAPVISPPKRLRKRVIRDDDDDGEETRSVPDELLNLHRNSSTETVPTQQLYPSDTRSSFDIVSHILEPESIELDPFWNKLAGTMNAYVRRAMAMTEKVRSIHRFWSMDSHSYVRLDTSHSTPTAAALDIPAPEQGKRDIMVQWSDEEKSKAMTLGELNGHKDKLDYILTTLVWLLGGTIDYVFKPTPDWQRQHEHSSIIWEKHNKLPANEKSTFRQTEVFKKGAFKYAKKRLAPTHATNRRRIDCFPDMATAETARFLEWDTWGHVGYPRDQFFLADRLYTGPHCVEEWNNLPGGKREQKLRYIPAKGERGEEWDLLRGHSFVHGVLRLVSLGLFDAGNVPDNFKHALPQEKLDIYGNLITRVDAAKFSFLPSNSFESLHMALSIVSQRMLAMMNRVTWVPLDNDQWASKLDSLAFSRPQRFYVFMGTGDTIRYDLDMEAKNPDAPYKNVTHPAHGDTLVMQYSRKSESWSPLIIELNPIAQYNHVSDSYNRQVMQNPFEDYDNYTPLEIAAHKTRACIKDMINANLIPSQFAVKKHETFGEQFLIQRLGLVALGNDDHYPEDCFLHHQGDPFERNNVIGHPLALRNAVRGG